MTKKILSDIISLSCLIFAPLTATLNIIFGLIEGPKILLKLEIIFILFLLTVFTVSVVIILRNKNIKFLNNKKTFPTISSIIYTLLSFIINTVACILKAERSGSLWNLYTIITLILFSVIFTIVYLYLRSHNFVFKAIVYLLITAIPYFVILSVISGFFKGTDIFIPAGIYILIYAITVVIFAVKSGKRAQKELDEKPYENQF